jgi:hypothetical protein
MVAYRKDIRWHFKAGGQGWAITDFADDWVNIEETRKNGQEDTHVYVEVELVEGKWKIEPGGSIDRELGVWVRLDIEDYLNKHGLPEENDG